MKWFPKLLILTGLLFGQDILKLKSGKVYEGLYFGELDGKIIFKIKGESESKTFNSEEVLSVNKNQGSVEIKENPSFEQDVLLHKSGKNYKGRYITKENDVIIFRLEGEKDIRRFLINDVDIIITNRSGTTVELYYPFDKVAIEEYELVLLPRPTLFGQEEFYVQRSKTYPWFRPWCIGLTGVFILIMFIDFIEPIAYWPI